MVRDALVGYLERYAAHLGPPLRTGVEVTAARPKDDGYQLDTTAGSLEARNVVVTGGKQAWVPPVASMLAAAVHQIHSSRYRHPGQLPPEPCSWSGLDSREPRSPRSSTRADAGCICR